MPAPETNLEHSKLDIERYRILFSFIKWLIAGGVLLFAFLMVVPRWMDTRDARFQKRLLSEYLSLDDVKNPLRWEQRRSGLESFLATHPEISSPALTQFLQSEKARIEAAREIHQQFVEKQIADESLQKTIHQLKQENLDLTEKLQRHQHELERLAQDRQRQGEAIESQERTFHDNLTQARREIEELTQHLRRREAEITELKTLLQEKKSLQKSREPKETKESKAAKIPSEHESPSLPEPESRELP